MSIGHHHHHNKSDSDTSLFFAIAINIVLTLAQVIGGIISGSLSLIADALHNLSDATSLGIAVFARSILFGKLYTEVNICITITDFSNN